MTIASAGRIQTTFAQRAGGSTLETSASAASVDRHLLDRQERVDTDAIQRHRLGRVREQLRARDVAGALLSDPLHIRYATGTRNMAIWTMHAPARYAFVSTEGPVVLFEMRSSAHLSAGLELVDEVHDSIGAFYLMAGSRVAEKSTAWAEQILGMVKRYGGGSTRLMVDRCEPWAAHALEERGVELLDANAALELARAVKSEEEIECARIAAAVGDRAIDAMRAALEPGITENQLWSVLHATNIAHNGEWIECRLLSAGQRTNPWFQESSNHAIAAGDMVAFDTDMVGPLGYLFDASRSFVCPGRRPTAEQRALYEIAQEEVMRNMELVRPGVSFREFAEKAWLPPEVYRDNRYPVVAHGCGFVDEYPFVPALVDFATDGYDGFFTEGMIIAVESYIGASGGREGVKLEQPVVVRAGGVELLSASPFLDALEV